MFNSYEGSAQYFSPSDYYLLIVQMLPVHF